MNYLNKSEKYVNKESYEYQNSVSQAKLLESYLALYSLLIKS